MRRQDVHEELRARLHEAAEAHEPDRARMLARIERGMGERGRPGRRERGEQVRSWSRVAAVTAAVAGTLAAGGYVMTSAVGDGTPPRHPRTVAVSPTPAPSREPASRPPAIPSASAERDGPLRSDGSVDPHSNDFWAQSDLTLRTTEQLTSLTVRLRIAQTGGVGSTGAWRSLPERDFDLTVGERNGFLVYTWVLRKGRTVPEGEWVFAGQYDHERGGRDAGDDRYTVEATAGGDRRSVGGGFAARTGAGGDP